MSGTTITSSASQWMRACSLIVADDTGDGLELAGPDQPQTLRIKFNVEYLQIHTPAALHARIYNLAPSTVQRLKALASKNPAGTLLLPFPTSARVVLKAGYQQNFGELFRGNIYQMRIGKETNVDSYLDIFAADGDAAHDWASMQKSLAKGYTSQDIWNHCGQSMQAWQVTTGDPPTGLSTTPSPRGCVLFGMTRDRLRDLSQTNNFTWNIYRNQLQGVPKFGVRPGQAVIINSTTGQIGTPEQTESGITVTTLLNPALSWGSKIQLNNTEIAALTQQLPGLQAATPLGPGAQKGVVPPINTDGLYTCLYVSHVGDTRGQEWYSRITALSIDPTALPPQSFNVQAPAGVGAAAASLQKPAG
jgi:hypothetical protein